MAEPPQFNPMENLSIYRRTESVEFLQIVSWVTYTTSCLFILMSGPHHLTAALLLEVIQDAVDLRIQLAPAMRWILPWAKRVVVAAGLKIVLELNREQC